MTRAHRIPTAGLLIAALFAGCDDGSGPSEVYVITGTIQNNTQAAMPPNTRLLVVWTVSSGSPDYSYVFGEGALDPTAGTFRIEFNQSPPTQALNAGALGVGIIAATTNQSVGNGDDMSTVPDNEVVGAAGQYGVIFTTTPAQAAQYRAWANAFAPGFGVGVGVVVPGDFDRFDPTSSSSVILIIDDLANIEFVNWT